MNKIFKDLAFKAIKKNPKSRENIMKIIFDVNEGKNLEYATQELKSYSSDLAIPDDLSEKGRLAAETIVKVLNAFSGNNTGGCETFFTPDAWKKRGEKYGGESELIIVHEGGAAPFFDYDYCQYHLIDRMTNELNKVGVYSECCTRWYSAVYIS